MKKEHLVKFINEGKMFGIQLSPADSKVMGWIAVAKYSINQRVFDVLANDPDSPVYKKEKIKMEISQGQKTNFILIIRLNDDFIFPFAHFQHHARFFHHCFCTRRWN